ncbi:MAG: YegP family protein [Gammaproteobacteria bacterium]
MSGKYEIYQDSRGKFRFRLKADNGQNILASQAYASRDACEKGIASVRANSEDHGRYERKEAQDGKQYFVLTAGNSQIIGQSQMYASSADVETGIKSVMRNGPTQSVDELTV